jgi:phytoene dehydrogenase-like protein
MSVFDVIIIGGGHNGLTAAGYLARAGRTVLVLERNAVVGGAAVTGEIGPGHRVSTASYLISLLLPEVERELELGRHGSKVLPRNPSSFTPLEDGRSLLMGPDAEFNRREIARFSTRDAEAWPRYEALLNRIADCLEPTLMETPADLLPLPRHWRKRGFLDRLRHLGRGHKLYRALAKLGDDLPEAMEILVGAARPILDRWFESDTLKSTLATDAIIGTFQPISAPGTAYVLLHHVMGRAGGARGVWGYVEGGMGALTQALAKSAMAAGAEIRTGCPVAAIEVAGGRAVGVRLASGEVLPARAVASNADAHVTFEKLLAPDHLPPKFREAVARIDYSSASMKINLAVSELPDFSCMPGKAEPGPQHMGTIHIGAATLEELERAYDDAKYGRPSAKPIIEMTIPSALDRTLAPAGHHMICLFVQYAPYRLAAGTWDTLKEGFADRCINEIGRLAPNLPGSVLYREVLSPLDLERRFGLTGGNIFQGSMGLHQLFSLRPVAGWSDYRTPLPGLYLCGAAAHPGGGVMGAAGRNAAREMLRDL